MNVEIQITRRRIVARARTRLLPMTGALAEFSGIVRAKENGGRIAALEYEAYSPMAERVMRDIIADLGKKHPCLSVRVTHRIGVVRVGEIAIQLSVTAAHRAEAFAMLEEFMNRLKQDVPIWKRRALRNAELKALKSASVRNAGSQKIKLIRAGSRLPWASTGQGEG